MNKTTQIVYLLVALSLLFSFLTFCFLLLLRALSKLKSKGGNLRVGFFLSLFLAAAIFITTYSLISTFNIDPWIKYIISYSVTCPLFYLLIPVVPEFTKYFTKEAKLKITPGPRKLNPKLIGYLLLSSYVLSIIFLLLTFSNIGMTNSNDARSFYFKMFVLFLTLPTMLIKIPKIYHEQIKEMQQLEVSSFVLYLRAFKNENDIFYHGRYLSEMGKTLKEQEASYNSNIANINFETYFSFQFKINIGELVGLGNPEELQAHESAKLIYSLDDWREKLTFLLNSCRCIVMLPYVSNNIRYELTEILNLGLSQQLYFFTEPKSNSIFSHISWRLLNFALYKIPIKWDDFQNMLNDIGYSSSIAPNRGSIITLNFKN